MTNKRTMKVQIGGTHYSEFAIQPTDYIVKNKLDWYEANMVKYTSRHKLKGGATDIKKVIHYAQMLLEDTYGIVTTVRYSDDSDASGGAAAPAKKTRRKRRKIVTPLGMIIEESDAQPN